MRRGLCARGAPICCFALRAAKVRRLNAQRRHPAFPVVSIRLRFVWVAVLLAKGIVMRRILRGRLLHL